MLKYHYLIGMASVRALAVLLSLCTVAQSAKVPAPTKTYNVVDLGSLFFEALGSVTQERPCVCQLEDWAQSYLTSNPTASSAQKGVALVGQCGSMWNKTAPPPPEDCPQASLQQGGTPQFADIIVQYIWKITVNLATSTCDATEQFVNASLGGPSVPAPTCSTNQFANIEVICQKLFEAKGKSCTEGEGKTIYDNIQTECDAQDQATLYNWLIQMVYFCFEVADYAPVETTAVPSLPTTEAETTVASSTAAETTVASSTAAETTVVSTTAVPTTSASQVSSDTAVNIGFCDAMVELFLSNINIQWQISLMIAEYTTANPGATQEQIAQYFIECVVKIKNGEAGPPPSVEPADFPENWADALFTMIIDTLVVIDQTIVEALDQALTDMGITVSGCSCETDKWENVLLVFEAIISKCGLTTDMPEFVSLQELLLSSETDEYKLSHCRELMFRLICVCFGYEIQSTPAAVSASTISLSTILSSTVESSSTIATSTDEADSSTSAASSTTETSSESTEATVTGVTQTTMICV